MASNSGPNIGKHARVSSVSSEGRETVVEDGDNGTADVKGQGAGVVKSEEASHESKTCEPGPKITTEIPEDPTYFDEYDVPLPQITDPVDNMQEMDYHILHFIQDDDPYSGGREAAECYFTAAIEPPITLESLTELDMPRIINNPRLRHDVNFDRELHFRPNLDGSKGKEKIKLADDYWKALRAEIWLYGHKNEREPHCRDAGIVVFWINCVEHAQKRLPVVFQAIRDILLTLVPDYDQQAVKDRIDVTLLMQQIKNGVCDLADLAHWLSRVLKNHCAPMRDLAVNAMEEKLESGAIKGDSELMVSGIRQLFDILEAMKLDVANHQIRHMRPLLVDDTVNFQRRYNHHRIQMGKIDVQRSRMWFDQELMALTAHGETVSYVDAINSYLLKGLLFNDTAEKEVHPQTFYLDSDRLKGVAVDLRSIVYENVCRDVLLELAPAGTRIADTAKAVSTLQVSMKAIVGMAGKYEENLSNIAAEIMRIVLNLEGRTYPFDATLLHFIEDRLLLDLQFDSPTFEKAAQELYDRMLPVLNRSVEQHVALSALYLQDQLVPHTQLPAHPVGFGAVCMPPKPRVIDPETDIVRRLTHMISLHWQVWAELVYLATADDDQDSSASSGFPTPPSSGSVSPMVPMAQAVYAPGRKWLPIGITVTEVPSGGPSPLPSPGLDGAPSASNNKSGSNKSEQADEAPDAPTSEQSPVDSEQQQAA